MPDILLLNDPNLGVVGRGRADVDGTGTLAGIERAVAMEIAPWYQLISVQRDCEGELIGPSRTTTRWQARS